MKTSREVEDKSAYKVKKCFKKGQGDLKRPATNMKKKNQIFSAHEKLPLNGFSDI